MAIDSRLKNSLETAAEFAKAVADGLENLEHNRPIKATARVSKGERYPFAAGAELNRFYDESCFGEGVTLQDAVNINTLFALMRTQRRLADYLRLLAERA